MRLGLSGVAGLVVGLELALSVPVFAETGDPFSSIPSPDGKTTCDSAYQGKRPSQESLSQIIAAHSQWLSDRTTRYRDREPTYANADLTRTDLREVDLSGANLRGANLDQANLATAQLGQSRPSGRES